MITVTSSSNAKWALEVEHGDAQVEYFAIESLLIDGESLRIVSADQITIEFSRDSIRKLLIMRTDSPSNPGKRARKPRSRKKDD